MNDFTFWTDEEIEQLKTLWGIGESGSVIARALGKSRNSIMSKIHRLKLQRKTGYGIDRAIRKPRVARATGPLKGRAVQKRPYRAATMPLVGGAAVARGPKAPRNLPAVVGKPIVTHRKRSRLPEHFNDDKVFQKLVEELKPPENSIYNIPNSFQCKWITGDVKQGEASWCRKPSVGGKSWCKLHLGLIYQPPQERRSRR